MGQSLVTMCYYISFEDLRETIIEKTKDLSTADAAGKTPLLWAIESSNFELASRLIEASPKAIRSTTGAILIQVKILK